jgi:hypothetical protein
MPFCRVIFVKMHKIPIDIAQLFVIFFLLILFKKIIFKEAIT